MFKAFFRRRSMIYCKARYVDGQRVKFTERVRCQPDAWDILRTTAALHQAAPVMLRLAGYLATLHEFQRNAGYVDL
jgi:hypothetical protein